MQHLVFVGGPAASVCSEASCISNRLYLLVGTWYVSQLLAVLHMHCRRCEETRLKVSFICGVNEHQQIIER